MNALETLPVVRVAIGGTDGAAIDAAILDLEIAARTYAPASCELRLRDPHGDLAAAFEPGASLVVRVGLDQERAFDGTLAAVEYRFGPAHDRELLLLAYDSLDVLRRRMPVRVHVDTTFGDLARELVADLGITVDCPAVTAVHRRIVQHRRSDLDVLTGVAEGAGLAFHLDGTTLHAYPVAGRGEPVSLRYGENVREMTVVRSDAVVANAVTVRGWDAHRVKARRGDARDAGAGREAPPLTDVLVESDAHADALARSQLDRRARERARLDAVVEGDVRYAPGVRVRLHDVPADIAGPHALTSVTHRFTPDLGFVSVLGTALPAPHPPTGPLAATLGVVVDVRDPAGLGRIKVKYPTVDDAESGWLQVLAAGAGGGKGLVAIPAVNDDVLVLVLGGDPANGIVIGALYGSDGMPARKKGAFSGYAFYSPSGHVIELDDADALSLYAAGGSFLTLGKNGTTLHSERDFTLEAPGKNITIRAQRVDIERT